MKKFAKHIDLNLDKIKEYVDRGLVKCNSHPQHPDYKIYSYNQKAQYEGDWSQTLMACRGLIYVDDVLYKRPFPKFFNLSELNLTDDDLIRLGPWSMTEKMDGSLGILYWIDGVPSISTKGSFGSDQARVATNWVRQECPLDEDDRYTDLFEIIYPINHIVVNYYGWKGLVYLGSIENETGKLHFRDCRLRFDKDTFNVLRVQHHGTEVLPKFSERDNKEGYVLRSKSGTFKLKHEDYVRKHAALSQISTKSIWDAMSNHKDLAEELSELGVPDEVFDWTKDKQFELNKRYKEVLKDSLDCLSETESGERMGKRKEQATYILKNAKYPSVVFALLDGKNWRHIIMNIIQPKYETPNEKY